MLPILSLLILLLSDCFTRRHAISRQKKNSLVAFGLPHLLIELFFIGIPVMRTDGHLAKVTTKISLIHI